MQCAPAQTPENVDGAALKEKYRLERDKRIRPEGQKHSGILAGYHLKQAGVSTFRNIDHAGDFGGAWYWNRYPGLQCDNDAYCYLP